jgi:multidrug resistance efflux pump
MLDHLPINRIILKSKFQKKFIFSILLIIAASLAYFYFSPQSLEYYIVSSKDVTETIVTSGRTEAVQNLELAFDVSGIVEQVLFQEGDKVQKDDVIIKLKADQEKTKLGLLQQQFTTEQNKALEMVKQKSIEAQRKQKEYENLLALEGLGAVSKEELEISKNSAETAASNLALAEIELRDTSTTNGSSQANLQLEQARISLENKYLKSPIQGTILSIAKLPGEYITPGATVVKISSDRPLISLEIDEKQYTNLKIGQKVLVSMQANPEQIFEGSISSISADVDATKGILQ